eukprot:366401-Chlamydomonas_euryale.AAC.6
MPTIIRPCLTTIISYSWIVLHETAGGRGWGGGRGRHEHSGMEEVNRNHLRQLDHPQAAQAAGKARRRQWIVLTRWFPGLRIHDSVCTWHDLGVRTAGIRNRVCTRWGLEGVDSGQQVNIRTFRVDCIG